jgi:hypothetical protein
MLLGRYSRLALDSWTRPKYAALNGKKSVDRTIAHRSAGTGRTPGPHSGSP